MPLVTYHTYDIETRLHTGSVELPEDAAAPYASTLEAPSEPGMIRLGGAWHLPSPDVPL